VVKPTAVGKTPRYASQTRLPPGAEAASRTKAGRNGAHASAPTTQHRNTVCSGDTRRRTTFSVTTPPAYAVAASRHRSTPPRSTTPPLSVAAAITAAPANAMAPPANTFRENPSPRNSPARIAVRTGPTRTIMEAVPAST
jgi:hypothetical protein